MYKLYDYDVHSLIDESRNEYDIINTISSYMETVIGQRFLIIYHNEEQDMDEIYRVIKTVRDYGNYLMDYNDRLKAMNCMELKKDILERKEHLKKR